MTASAHLFDPPRIGPNAIIQVAGALRDRFGALLAEPLVHDATGYSMSAMPSDMVDEREAQALMRAVVDKVGPWLACSVMREGGHRTGDYLLANRIPRIAQWAMRLAPRRVGLALLLRAMSANAWTFAGSGQFCVRPTSGIPELVFEHCTMCRDMHADRAMCDFYAGTFERLIQAVVSRYASVVEVECMAHGGSACRFEIHGV
jgi:divinyl protochlorophyllide a 8-vinyl-reductase